MRVALLVLTGLQPGGRGYQYIAAGSSLRLIHARQPGFEQNQRSAPTGSLIGPWLL